jgi:hypothetical protein
MSARQLIASVPFRYAIAICVLFIIVFSYTFDAKLDFNGDNVYYYQLSTSMLQGHGYSDMINEDYKPSDVFPPGYPLLMCLVRIFTPSIIPQKILNGLFLLGAVLLLFYFIRKSGMSTILAFVAAVAGMINPQVLDYASIMMSEMSFLFFSALSIWAIMKMTKEKPFYRDKYFYFLILFASFAYHIRAQGFALLFAIIVFFIFAKKWKEIIGFIAGFAVCYLPWMIRNKMAGLGQSRYISIVSMANPWRPEEGQLGIGEIIVRFFDTLKMLVTQAIPASIPPFASVNYQEAPGFADWITGIILIGIIAIGLWQFKQYKWLFIGYIAGSLGLISIFSSPSDNRYLTVFIPFLQVGIILGLHAIMTFVVRKLSIANSFTPWLLTLVLIMAIPGVRGLSEMNKASYPSPYLNFYKMAEVVREKYPKDIVVCSRKPEMWYFLTGTHVTNYTWTSDDVALIRDLVTAKADYVILENLGYSSTGLYLYPALQKHSDLFAMKLKYDDPPTWFMKFDREKAKQQLAIP